MSSTGKLFGVFGTMAVPTAAGAAARSAGAGALHAQRMAQSHSEQTGRRVAGPALFAPAA